MGSAPWSLWSAAQAGKSENTAVQANIAAVMDESMRACAQREQEPRPHENFAIKAWMQADRSSGAWIWTCPKEHNMLNQRQFPVMIHTYFGVGQECLKGLVGKTIQQKYGGSMEDKVVRCDEFGENMVKATLPRSGWTYTITTRSTCRFTCSFNNRA